MIIKKSLLCALGLLTAGAVVAQPGGGAGKQQDGPDFVLEVPLNLVDMPGEVHTVVLWCDILNATYGSGGAREAFPDPKYLNFKGEPRVVAQTGSVEIQVLGSQAGAQGAGSTSGGSGAGKTVVPPPKWTLGSVLGKMPRGAPPTFVPAEYYIEPAGIKSTKSMPPDVVPVKPDKTVKLQASVTGATNPALGTAYACYMGFKASAVVNGAMQNFTVFAPDAQTYTGMPAKDDVPARELRPGTQQPPNRNKILTVIGNIGDPNRPLKR